MSNYRRIKQPGGTFFFTANLSDRRSDLLLREIDKLRAAARATKASYPFEIDAIVILPSSIHTIWTLPPDDDDYSKRWRMLKSLFSRDLPGPAERTASQIKRGEKGLWQRRFWEHRIRDPHDLEAHRQFIYSAPVKEGYVRAPQDWLYSSIHRDLATPFSRNPNAQTVA